MWFALRQYYFLIINGDTTGFVSCKVSGMLILRVTFDIKVKQCTFMENSGKPSLSVIGRELPNSLSCRTAGSGRIAMLMKSPHSVRKIIIELSFAESKC